MEDEIEGGWEAAGASRTRVEPADQLEAQERVERVSFERAMRPLPLEPR
jgi:hypothetical protein